MTGFRHKYNPLQKRDALGRWISSRRSSAAADPEKKKAAGVVPYVRVSPRSATAGVNAGTKIPGRHLRVSVGGYVRIENTKKSELEKRLRAGYNEKLEKFSPHEAATPLIKQGIGRAVNRVIAGQVQLKGGAASARVGTSRNLMPSVVVRRGSSKVTAKKRAAAISDYNRAIAAGQKIKGMRPQRRGKK